MPLAERGSVDRWLIAFALLAAIGVARIVLTYRVFSQTYDEPSNLACGMEWLDKGTYHYDPKHPPLGRVAVAMLPYLSGLRSTGSLNPYVEGNAILAANGAYQHNLTLARLGTLPFFLLSSLVVWLWTAGLFGRRAAFAAALLYTTLPAILGNSSEATADMALAATLPAALHVFCLWLERPTAIRALLLGFTLACATLSKFTALAFLPVCLLVLWVGHLRLGSPPRQHPPSPGVSNRAKGLTMALALFLFSVWGAYRFSWAPLGPIRGSHPGVTALADSSGTLHVVLNTLLETPVPVPELARGVSALWQHNQERRASYFLGRCSVEGWWYYFPVILVVKTPIAFLILTVCGIWSLVRRRKGKPTDSNAWQATALPLCAMVILLVGLFGRVHLGLRHILSIYPILAIIAGYGAFNMLRSTTHGNTARYVAAGLILWQVASSAAAHPDYLAYFNEFAGAHPEKFMGNAELDLGQDLKRLSEVLQQLKVSSVALAYYGSADLSAHWLPEYRPLEPYRRTPGWVAVSVHRLKMGACPPERVAYVDAYSWLEAYQPVARAGKSIRVYFVPRDP